MIHDKNIPFPCKKLGREWLIHEWLIFWINKDWKMKGSYIVDFWAFIMTQQKMHFYTIPKRIRLIGIYCCGCSSWKLNYNLVTWGNIIKRSNLHVSEPHAENDRELKEKKWHWHVFDVVIKKRSMKYLQKSNLYQPWYSRSKISSSVWATIDYWKFWKITCVVVESHWFCCKCSYLIFMSYFLF